MPDLKPCVEPTFNKSFFLLAFCYDYYPDRESKEYIWTYHKGLVTKLGYTIEETFVLSCFDKKRVIPHRFNKDVMKFMRGDFTKMSVTAKNIISEFCNKTYDETIEVPYEDWIDWNYETCEWYHNIQPALYCSKLHLDIQAKHYGLEDCEAFPVNEELWSKPDLDKEDYYYEMIKFNTYNPYVELKTVLYNAQS